MGSIDTRGIGEAFRADNDAGEVSDAAKQAEMERMNREEQQRQYNRELLRKEGGAIVNGRHVSPEELQARSDRAAAERERKAPDAQARLMTEITGIQTGIERLYGEVEQLKKTSPGLVEGRLATIQTYERIRDIKQDELEGMAKKAA